MTHDRALIVWACMPVYPCMFGHVRTQILYRGIRFVM
ncbi:Protein of unknown function [Thermobacillus xylanilyticus]|uniref:Uncharacterized protein n=1 Tax=Thermobacillus xylanilyticus TaxID=76633 RepID=A0ABN7S041_THEXY|nr:Protein of unknown function [Thermobacillus xylanilyticus]